jgi:protein involved in polysaccharide export with SLBB domain
MEMTKRLLLLTLITLGMAYSASAQDLFYRKNLANIRVDNLSQDQVLKFQQQIQSSNMSEQEVASYLYSKGLSREEVAKLKKRMGGLTNKSGGSSVAGDFELLDQYFKLRDSLQMVGTDSLLGIKKDPSYVRSREIPDSVIFGAELFTNAKMRFALDGQMATPANYVLGPGDVVNLTLYGQQEVNTEIKILPNGSINIPYAGLLAVAGLKIEQASRKIATALQNNGYASLGTGETKISLTIAEFRSMHVTVIGAKAAGNFLIPSVATVFHVLHLAGGPAKYGTYRDIEVIRKGKVVQRVDLYKFLVSGDQTDNINLQENDVINIPVYEHRVLLKGEVKRPGLFELRTGENFEQLLKYAGGFTPIGYKEGIYVEQIATNEFTTRDIAKAGFADYTPAAGDVIVVGSIVNRYSQRIAIGGSVHRPGYYGWEADMKLSTLFERAGGLKENALMTRGLVFRGGREHDRAYARFIPQEVVSGQSDLVLEDGDSVVIGDRQLLFPDEFVTVMGEVQQAGPVVHGKGLTAMDAILMAGGLKKSAFPNRIEVARRIDKTSEMVVAKVLDASSDFELMVQAEEVMLEAGDYVLVRPNPNFKPQRVAVLSGELLYPGPYVLLNQKEQLSDLIKRAGGLTDMADIMAAYVVRESVNPVYAKVVNKIESKEKEYEMGGKMEKMNQSGNEGKGKLDLFSDADSIIVDTISIDLVGLLGRKGSKYDIQLREGDKVFIPAKQNTIAVRGEVNNTLMVNYAGRNLRTYLRDAGGTSKFADKKRIYVVEPSGKSRQTVQFMGIRKYPKVIPGSVVMVPAKPTQQEGGVDPSRLAAISSLIGSTASMLFIVITLVR